jgi:glyoxylase-like metal-dependent hydrolase (beta-lactamase superfamily II)/ferredoxin
MRRRAASSAMARRELRRPENAPGDLFVDRSCIDCDTCRWMAPEVFGRVGRQSAVVAQPRDAQARRAALHALLSCPTASIGTEARAADLAEAQRDFPLPVAPGILHLGYHAASSFGATSYLVQAPQGNILVDAPRWSEPLARRIEEMGGARWLLLTHRDDVADHDRYAARLGLERVLHRRDAPVRGGPVERLLDGDEPVELLPGLTAIPVPGHTAGHVAYHWAGTPGGALFTGDHLAFDEVGSALEAWPDVCWHDWGEQTRSMERLLGWDFEWVLPGHGRRGRLPGPRMRDELRRLVAWMRAEGASR